MLSDISSISELIDKLRDGHILEPIELTIENKGKINKIIIKKKQDDANAKSIDKAVRKVKIKSNGLEEVDFSNLDLSGSDFSKMNLSRSDFSYSRITNADLSGANLSGADLYKARISQTDMSNSYGIRDLSGSYLTGSVNLYNAEPSTPGPITNPYDYFATRESEMHDDTLDISRVLMGRQRNY